MHKMYHVPCTVIRISDPDFHDAHKAFHTGTQDVPSAIRLVSIENIYLIL